VPYLSEAFGKVRGWAERAKHLTTELEALGDEAEIGAPVDQPESPVGKLSARVSMKNAAKCDT